MTKSLSKIFPGSNGRYDDFDQATKDRIDLTLNGIDAADINQIVLFGNEPLEKVGELAEQIIREQSKMNGLSDDLKSAIGQMGEFDLSDLKDSAQEFAGKAVKTVARNKSAIAGGVLGFLAAGPLGAMIGGAGGAGLSAAKKIKLSPEERQAEALLQSARKSIAKVHELEERLSEAKDQIPQSILQIDEMGAQRRESFSELKFYIFAGQVMLDRYDTKFIPEASARYEGSNDNDDFETVQNLVLCRGALESRVVDLATAQTIDIHSAGVLANIKRLMSAALIKVTSHLQTSLPMWKGQAMQASMAATAFQLGKTLDEADRFGSRMLDDTDKLAGHTQKMIAESLARGAFDPEQVIAATKKLAKRMKDIELLSYDRGQSEDTLRRLTSAQADFAASMDHARERAIGQVREIAASAAVQARLPAPENT